ncbi:MAG: D-alanyl-D-alanine carboxypeptidase/D-alanyl-D-alanine-endopeptidase [Planctomycetaceae bacterium]|nr:D-alanyl-D-alanine carboxypeptidase/D-alanyl-D-alanine-endopeptidase [Planctomycetaceae bacterium]
MLKITKIITAIIVAAAIGQASFGSNLQQKIEQILARKDQKNVEFTISVIDPQTGSRIYGYNPSKPLTPASNMKLVTGFTALKTLGSDYKFVTKVGLVGGKLVVVGGGDPLLGYDGNDCISPIINALKAKNITQLEVIAVDSSIFENIRVNPNWPLNQLNRDYSCEISGLNYNGNCIKITASVNGGHIVLDKTPNTEFVQLINNVRYVKGAGAIGSNRTEQPNSLIVYGKCGRETSFDVAIENPSLYFGTLLSEAVYRAGISVANSLTEESGVQQPMEIIAQFETPITEVLQHCNKDSLQIAAECMGKMIAVKTNGCQGSWQSERDAVGKYLMSLGADNTEFLLDDGCGLSNANKLSSNVLSLILLDAYKSPLWSTFKPTLAVGGIDGTIKKQFYKEKYKNRVFAKTGYISGVRALSGVCIGASGREYIFSIITNKANYPTKKAISDIVESIIDEG